MAELSKVVSCAPHGLRLNEAWKKNLLEENCLTPIPEKYAQITEVFNAIALVSMAFLDTLSTDSYTTPLIRSYLVGELHERRF